LTKANLSDLDCDVGASPSWADTSPISIKSILKNLSFDSAHNLNSLELFVDSNNKTTRCFCQYLLKQRVVFLYLD